MLSSTFHRSVGLSLEHTSLHRKTSTALGISTGLSSHRASLTRLRGNSILKSWQLPNRPRLVAMHSSGGCTDDSIANPPLLDATGGGDEGSSGKKRAGDVRPQNERRRRGTGPLGRHLQSAPDLLTVPGIGPRNMQKLVLKGIGRVAELKQIYREKFRGDASDKMVEFLRNSVGIIHKNHAESITSYIKESVDEELKEDEKSQNGERAQKKRLTFCIEGNISVGKSTFLQRIANETLELRDIVEIVPEPVSKWQDIGPDHFNILDAFYAEPQRYAYTFQNYVFVTRVMQEQESASSLKPLRLMERSVFSDRMVFVRAVHEAKWMNEMEINIYDSWFDPVVSALPGLVPDGFIYLRASPDTCHNRLRLRNREEEQGVTLEYLKDLHEKHEQWLFPAQRGNHGVLSFSQLPLDLDEPMHPYIKDRVFYLGGEHVHSCIQKVPALVLDCEPNIDFSRDVEAKQHYARQIAKFFEFVKNKKETQMDKNQDVKLSNRLLLPQRGALVDADGNILRRSRSNSSDLKQPMSVFSN